MGRDGGRDGRLCPLRLLEQAVAGGGGLGARGRLGLGGRDGGGMADGCHDRLLEALKVGRGGAVDGADAVAAGDEEVRRRLVAGGALLQGPGARAGLIFGAAQGLIVVWVAGSGGDAVGARRHGWGLVLGQLEGVLRYQLGCHSADGVLCGGHVWLATAGTSLLPRRVHGGRCLAVFGAIRAALGTFNFAGLHYKHLLPCNGAPVTYSSRCLRRAGIDEWRAAQQVPGGLSPGEGRARTGCDE